jgi:6-phosphogluconolactonase
MLPAMNLLRGIFVAALALALTSCGGGNAPPPSTPIPVSRSSYLFIATTSGTISAYGIDSSGVIQAVNGSPFFDAIVTTQGVAVVNGYLYDSHPTTPSVAAYSINYSTGAIAEISSHDGLQTQPPSGSTILQNCGGRLFGFNENGWFIQFNLNSDGSFRNSIGFANGSIPGPRASLAMDSTCQHIYFALPSLNSIDGYSIANSTFSKLFLSPISVSGITPVALALAADGKFLYVANSGSNDVAVYAVDTITGGLTLVAGSPIAAGSQPTSIVVVDKYVYVTNAGDGTVSGYVRDTTSGALIPVAGSPFAVGIRPMQVISATTNLSVSPTGLLLFVANQGSNNVSAFNINTGGSLTAVPGSPFAASGVPTSLAFAVAPQ